VPLGRRNLVNFSLKHVLIDCVDVADVRQTFYNANSLSNLFTNVAGDTILQFLKEIDLYTKMSKSTMTYTTSGQVYLFLAILTVRTRSLTN
jgi:hypothetical protein